MSKKEKLKEKDKAHDEGKKNTSLRLDGKILKELKHAAIEDDSSVQQIVEQLIIDFLAQRRTTTAK